MTTASSYNHDSQTLALMGCCFLACYLTYACTTPPNPPPQTPYPKDSLGSWIVKQRTLSVRRSINLVMWIYHILLTSTFPDPPILICPQPRNLNPSLFRWNTYVIISLALVFLAAPIRLLAFAQLGGNFTLRLARPGNLVTSGLYAYAQHPSYPASLIVFFANAMLLLRMDGMLGCWLPGWVVQWRGAELVEMVGMVGLLGFACWGMAIRVKEEEEMLKKEFGREWEMYHRKTRRFVPGLF